MGELNETSGGNDPVVKVNWVTKALAIVFIVVMVATILTLVGLGISYLVVAIIQIWRNIL